MLNLEDLRDGASYTLKIRVEVGDDHSRVFNLFRHTAFRYTYWNSIVPPNKCDFELERLSKKGVLNWAVALNEIGCKYSLTITEWKKND